MLLLAVEILKSISCKSIWYLVRRIYGMVSGILTIVLDKLLIL